MEILNHQQINRTQKLNPNEPSEIAITLNLDKTEAGMVFQCIFGKDDQVDKIAENMRTLDITIFWDKDQSRIISPKFTLYRFGSGFTISTSRHKSSIAFDIGRILLDPGKYERCSRVLEEGRIEESIRIPRWWICYITICQSLRQGTVHGGHT